jgi:exosome complex component MTR3
MPLAAVALLRFTCPPLQSRVDGSLLLDPTADEAFREEAGLLLALMPTSNEVGLLGRQLGVGSSAANGCCQALVLLGQPSGPPCLTPAHPPELLRCCRVLAVPVTQLVSRGQWSSSQLREGLELAMGGCAQLDAAARQCLKQAAAEASAKQQQQQQQKQ